MGIASAIGGALLKNGGLNSASSILNAQNSNSWSRQSSVSDSWGSNYGQSSSNAYTNAWSNANSYSTSGEYGWSEGIGGSESESNWGGTGWSQSDAENWASGRVYGREASAQDIQNAREANQIQKDLWSMQADYNAKQAQIDRDYQEYMSNTSYQRAVADLLAAGLNPILAAGNMGASTPVGAMATSGLASAAKANAIAEQESSSYGYNKSRSEDSSWGSSSSSSYNRSRSENKGWSESESHSKSKEKSRSSSQSSESGSSGSHSQSNEKSKSKTKTQAKDMVESASDAIKTIGNAARDMITGGGAGGSSAKKQLTNKEKILGKSTGSKTKRNGKR